MCDRLGIVTEGAELDHILPLYKGGDNRDENLQMLCIECHRKKTAEDLGVRYRRETGPDGWPTAEVGVGGPKTSA
jgi:5-methylcytosine-specific restriction endonuclease McrA